MAEEKMVDLDTTGEGQEVELRQEDKSTEENKVEEEKVEASTEEQQLTTNVGLILNMGPDAYADKNKFHNGHWCLKGDWIVFAKYAGSRVKIEGGEIRILNDDEVLAKLDDPKDVLTLY